VRFPGPLVQVLGHLYEALRLMVVTLSTSLDLSFEYLRMSILPEHCQALGSLATKLQQLMRDGIYFVLQSFFFFFFWACVNFLK
jgi:hypothetical protein